MKSKIWQQRFLDLNPRYKRLKLDHENLFKQFETYRKNVKEEISSYRKENELFRKTLIANDLPADANTLEEEPKDDNTSIQVAEENKGQSA